MGFIKFIATRYFWINLLIALCLAYAIVHFTMSSLKGFTHHGESITVPDLNNLTLPEVEEQLTTLKLKFAVIDSSYLLKKKPNIVLDQDPDADSKVKEGRTIYLTVSRRVPPPVKVPNLIDLNLVFAQKALESAGLNTGELQYRPGLGKNKVIEQLYLGKPILAGKEIPKGSKISLILADGLGETKGEVPNLIGRTLEQAKWVLNTLNFNIGYVEFDATTKDSNTAVIYKQVPEYDQVSPPELNYGEAVDIYLTKELPEFLKQYSADSLNQ
ncbi:MAG: PASTA domain-containing protein [Chitinophagales bacterium]|nr:PASTA domain-containing protein [Chitinophagales bacterium]